MRMEMGTRGEFGSCGFQVSLFELMFGMHTDVVLEASETEDEPAEGEGRISTVCTRKCMLFLRCFELFKDCSRR